MEQQGEKEQMTATASALRRFVLKFHKRSEHTRTWRKADVRASACEEWRTISSTAVITRALLAKLL